MAILDEEIRLDAIEDAKAIAYIRQHLPAELQPRYDENILQDIIDLTVDQLANGPQLDSEADADGYVDIDMEVLANAVAQEAEAAGLGKLPEEEVLLIVEAWMDFEDEDFE